MKLNPNAYSLLYHTEQLKAAHAILNDTPDYFYRKVCRWYSKTFSTPLKEVEALPYHDILQHYYEDKMSDLGFNEVLSYTKKELLKVFVDRDEEAMAEWMQELEKEQAQTLHKKQMKDKQKKEQEEQYAREQAERQKIDIPEIDMNFEEKNDEND